MYFLDLSPAYVFFMSYYLAGLKLFANIFFKMQVSVNMRTKKVTKFLSKYEFPTRLPHPLTFLPKRRIIALCKQIEACLSAGAVAAGGTDIVTRIETGGFHWDEYDDVVAHPDFEESLHRLRKVLRNRLPTTKNGGFVRSSYVFPSSLASYCPPPRTTITTITNTREPTSPRK
ncbi:unnamed protein product [Dibothriocephalus latus]|uniref:Uncharacterized protein n=1 Tax=Dibothriocephalus latus TaxID=60516 RepID=A0A3P6Q6G9_DIBLA|nr:unnamed protein product [Dibothriocephalus latus]